MRNGNGANAQGAEHEVGIGSGGATRERKTKLAGRRISQRPECPGGGVHPRSDLAGDDRGAEAMIGVLVGEADVGQVAHVEAGLGAAAARLAQGKAGVDEDTGSRRLDEDAVPGAAARQDAKAHSLGPSALQSRV